MRLEAAEAGAAREDAEANEVAAVGGIIEAAAAAAAADEEAERSGLASGDGVGIDAGGEMLPAEETPKLMEVAEGELEGSTEEEDDLDSYWEEGEAVSAVEGDVVATEEDANQGYCEEAEEVEVVPYEEKMPLPVALRLLSAAAEAEEEEEELATSKGDWVEGEEMKVWCSGLKGSRAEEGR